MNLEDQTFQIIHSRLLAGVEDGLDKRQGSVVYDLTAPAAVEAELAYAFMATLLDRGFADSAEGKDLDRRVQEQGVERKPAIRATGYVTVSGTDGFTVEAGTVVLTARDVRFVVDTDGTIAGGSAVLSITALDGGARGNVGVHEITIIEGNLAGVSGVDNTVETTGGVDQEDDQALFARYVEKVSLPATSGNVYHYTQTAKEVVGVQDVRIFPLWKGPGTVRVVIAGDDGQPASPQLAAAVAEHIENIRPIGADVTVDPAGTVDITVSATVLFDTAYPIDEVRTEITDKVRAYIVSLGLTATAVLFSQCMKAIITTDGVIDCRELRINGAGTDVALADDVTPVVAGVEVNALID